VVCWKTTSNGHLKVVLPHLLHDDSIVVVLQNGLNIEAVAAEIAGPDRVVGGCCFLCCNKVGPGQIRHLDYGRIALGAWVSEAPQEDAATVRQIVLKEGLEDKQSVLPSRVQPPLQLTEYVHHWFHRAGIETLVSSSLAEVRWKKLCWNIPFNGLSVILGADTTQLMRDPSSRELASRLMDEVACCATACGVNVPKEHLEKMMLDTERMVPYASSMLLDYQNGREMEVEAIFGNPVRAAVQHGYHPRLIEMLYHQLSYLNRTRHNETSGVARGFSTI
jgi:2-dehydropantoate 2-reductase